MVIFAAQILQSQIVAIVAVVANITLRYNITCIDYSKQEVEYHQVPLSLASNYPILGCTEGCDSNRSHSISCPTNIILANCPTQQLVKYMDEEEV